MPYSWIVNRLVAIALTPGATFVAELQRVFDDGDAALPVDLRLGKNARAALVEAMAPGVLVAEPGERTPRPGGIPVEEGDALVMATSGTTGEPKGVVLTHAALEASARATSERLGVDPVTDCWWACLPFAHIGGLAVVLRSMVTGVGCEVVGGFSVEGAIAALERGATLTSLVPTALNRLAPETVAGFRSILLGGQAPPAELPGNVVATYGLTETGSGVVYDGVPLRGTEVRIAPGTNEIELRGATLLRAYRDGTDPKSSDGWLATGDAGEIAPDGRLLVHGRVAEVVITGGENVWPAAVEPVIERHPAVVRAAVAGRPDPEWGERVVAYVVLATETDPARLLEEVRDLVRAEIAGFAAPREVVIVNELPTTSLGKLRRESLSGLQGRAASL